MSDEINIRVLNYPKNGSGKQKGITGKLVFVAVLLFVLGSFLSSLVVYIGPSEYGIKEVKLGPNRGIHKEVYEAGWVLAIPGFSRFHKFPRDLQLINLTNYPSERMRYESRTEKAAHIQTSDGFFVNVDVSLMFRIVDPYLVITTMGPGSLFVDIGVIPRTEPVLKQALGTLKTEEFYNTSLRESRVAVAKELLEKELATKGLHVEQLLVRYFEYSPEIQRNIEEKKLKDQLVFKNQSEARAATAEANLKKITQEGEAKLAVKLQEGQAYITTKKAEQELYSRRMRAEADLTVKLAEADRTERKNQALQGAGSEYMVGLKMAEVMSGLEVVVLPSDGTNGVNPLDLERTLGLFGATPTPGNQAE